MTKPTASGGSSKSPAYIWCPKIDGEAAGPPGAPYGGALVDGVMSPEESRRASARAARLPSIRLFADFAYDAEKIALGAYSPLEGFMDSKSFESVVKRGRLPGGLPWTIPILLAPRPDDAAKIRSGDEVALLDGDARPFALLEAAEIYEYSKEDFARSVYGTVEETHPNVRDIIRDYGSIALAGEVRLIRRPASSSGPAELSPRETRALFKSKGWKNVAAYQCRNPPHLAHEYMQKAALERDEIDGLFIHPVIGRLKAGDFKPEVIMEAYRRVVEGYYPKEAVVLSPLAVTMRYAGPKAALFYAIVRKNYGATHFIVGRDQAGLGGLYDPYACHRIFDDFDVGVQALRYRELFYCRVCGFMASEKTCPHPQEHRESVSQTRMRQLIKEGKPLPQRFLRPEVIDLLSRGDVLIR